jgi:hypothetical protein
MTRGCATLRIDVHNTLVLVCRPMSVPLSRDQGAYCGLIMRVCKLLVTPTRTKVSPIPSSNCFAFTLLA